MFSGGGITPDGCDAGPKLETCAPADAASTATSTATVILARIGHSLRQMESLEMPPPERTDSPIVAFYRRGAADDRGRTLDAILAWDDNRLEAVHDYIQWLFPLDEPSRFNPSATLLTPRDRAAFREPALAACAMCLLGSMIVAAVFFGDPRLRTPYDPYAMILALYAVGVWLARRRARPSATAG